MAPLSDAPLSFGYGELLKDGAGEGDLDAMASQAGLPDSFLGSKQDASGRSLKGKYIVRVGWDDVRGWLGEGGTLIGSSRCPSCKFNLSLSYFTCSVLLIAPYRIWLTHSPHPRRSSSGRREPHQIRYRLSCRLWW